MRRLIAFLLLVLAVTPGFAQEVTGSAAVTAQYQDPATIERITLRLMGQGRESWETVIADGEPPLTWGTVATFSILLHETFDAQLTEAEAELLAKRLAESYRRSDESGRAALTTEWQQMLGTLNAGNRQALRTKLDTRLRTAAAAGAKWASVTREALDRRSKVLHASEEERPEWAAEPGFDATMSVADLDAGMELLYFMWVASGRDPELVTLDAVAAIRDHFRQNFAELPAGLQYALANAQKIYAGLRVVWYTGDRGKRAQMARNFGQELDGLGLTDPNAGARQESAWSDVAGKSRGDFAAEMVVGLAGSSYKSAW